MPVGRNRASDVCMRLLMGCDGLLFGTIIISLAAFQQRWGSIAESFQVLHVGGV